MSRREAPSSTTHLQWWGEHQMIRFHVKLALNAFLDVHNTFVGEILQESRRATNNTNMSLYLVEMHKSARL
jgi:hypothetical protein